MRQLVDIELMSEVGIQLAPLAVPGLRADALVCEGAGVAPKAVCAPHHQPLFHIQPIDRFHVYLVGFQLQMQHGVQTGSPIECGVAARRFGSQSYGMPLAEVGLPIGVDVDRASLARLLDDWTISRYEEQPDRIVFYRRRAEQY